MNKLVVLSRTNEKTSHQLGISLVEMAVVLVVIGVIIGAVLKVQPFYTMQKNNPQLQIQQLISKVQL